MGTEDRPSAYLDEMEPFDALSCMMVHHEAPIAVRKATMQIFYGLKASEGRLSGGKGRLVYAGAGTSGRLACQDGAELKPTYGWPYERLVTIMAGGDRALKESVEHAEDSVIAGEVIAANRIRSEDVVIVVAARGTTPFTVAVLREACRKGAFTVGIANNAGTPLLTESHCPIFLDTGPELVEGSTRLKAGNAQRHVLGIFSTLLMVRLGYIYKGLMLNVWPTNEKLKARAMRNVCRLTCCDEITAEVALTEAKWETGVAALMIKGHDLRSAETLYLEMAHRNYRRALEIAEIDSATV